MRFLDATFQSKVADISVFYIRNKHNPNVLCDSRFAAPLPSQYKTGVRFLGFIYRGLLLKGI